MWSKTMCGRFIYGYNLRTRGWINHFCPPHLSLSYPQVQITCSICQEKLEFIREKWIYWEKFKSCIPNNEFSILLYNVLLAHYVPTAVRAALAIRKCLEKIDLLYDICECSVQAAVKSENTTFSLHKPFISQKWNKAKSHLCRNCNIVVLFFMRRATMGKAGSKVLRTASVDGVQAQVKAATSHTYRLCEPTSAHTQTWSTLTLKHRQESNHTKHWAGLMVDALVITGCVCVCACVCVSCEMAQLLCSPALAPVTQPGSAAAFTLHFPTSHHHTYNHPNTLLSSGEEPLISCD